MLGEFNVAETEAMASREERISPPPPPQLTPRRGVVNVRKVRSKVRFLCKEI